MTDHTTLLDDVALILDWSRLEPEQIDKRIDWLRSSLTAGEDWGYSPEVQACVLKTNSASMLYKLTWFEPDQQTLIDKPQGLKIMNIDETRG